MEIVLQDGCLGLKLYCNTINVLQAAGDKIMSQYKIVLRQKGKALGRGAQVGVRRRACCGAQGERVGARRAAGARARAGALALAGARARADVQAGVARGRWVGEHARGRAAAGRRRRRVAGRWARGRALGARQGAGRAAGRWARGRALGAQQGAGRTGWPRAVHSVHLACFWLVLTRYFS